jgi:hypothetical protein
MPGGRFLVEPPGKFRDTRRALATDLRGRGLLSEDDAAVIA